MEFIIGRKGNQKLPITDSSVSREHCKVTLNDNKTFTIENLSQNGTLIDGVPIIKGTAKLDSVLTLGKTFQKSLRELIGDPFTQTSDSQKQTKEEDKTPSYSIAHLERIWNEFNDTNLEMAEKQRKINLTRTGIAIFTMAAVPTIFFLGPVGYVLTGIGIIGNAYSFVGMKNSETVAQKQQRQDEFDESWVCPNPDCGKNIPARNWKNLIRNHKTCPYCKCRYIQ